jgi:hypothetical protein
MHLVRVLCIWLYPPSRGLVWVAGDSCDECGNLLVLRFFRAAPTRPQILFFLYDSSGGSCLFNLSRASGRQRLFRERTTPLPGHGRGRQTFLAGFVRTAAFGVAFGLLSAFGVAVGLLARVGAFASCFRARLHVS